MPWRGVLDAAMGISGQCFHFLSGQPKAHRAPPKPFIQSDAVWGWERHQTFSKSHENNLQSQELVPKQAERCLASHFSCNPGQFVFLAFSAILFSTADLALPFYPAVLCITITTTALQRQPVLPSCKCPPWVLQQFALHLRNRLQFFLEFPRLAQLLINRYCFKHQGREDDNLVSLRKTPRNHHCIVTAFCWSLNIKHHLEVFLEQRAKCSLQSKQRKGTWEACSANCTAVLSQDNSFFSNCLTEDTDQCCLLTFGTAHFPRRLGQFVRDAVPF